MVVNSYPLLFAGGSSSAARKRIILGTRPPVRREPLAARVLGLDEGAHAHKVPAPQIANHLRPRQRASPHQRLDRLDRAIQPVRQRLRRDIVRRVWPLYVLPVLTHLTRVHTLTARFSYPREAAAYRATFTPNLPPCGSRRSTSRASRCSISATPTYRTAPRRAPRS